MGKLANTALSLVFVALLAAVAAIGWKWGSNKSL